MVNKKICAFLDLLGFSNYTLTDTIGALNLLSNYQDILNQKVTDNNLHPAESYSSVELQKTAERSLIDSFEYFVPFSDSILIVSSEPDKFIMQLSRFLLDCFILTAHAYSFPENREAPTEVTRKSIRLSKEGKVEVSERKERWYPTLFRGGVSFEEVIPIDLSSIAGKALMKIKNLTGRAIVQAVALEKLDKGPRIFCEPEFYGLLGPDVQYLIAPHRDGKHYEVLWPAIEYIEFNDCRNELPKFDQIFIPAANLWKSLHHTKVGIHYYKFLRLIVKSSLSFFQWRGYLVKAEGYISGVINKAGLESKANDLMGSHFI